MIGNLPTWNFNNLKPSFNDLESATAVEMVYKLYGKNRELIDDYNKFLNDIRNIRIGAMSYEEPEGC